MQQDLNRLRIFYHVHSHLSITEAAEMLHITPSAVSQQLKKLEAEIKTSLFTRLHKRLVPTPAGNNLFATVGPLLEGLQAGMEQLEKEWTGAGGVLKVGAPLEFGSIYLPEVIASFRALYSKVNFELEIGLPSSLLSKLSSGELDFAFVDTFPTKEQYAKDFGIFSIKPVIEEEVVLACSKKYSDEYLLGDHSFENLGKRSFISQQIDSRALNNWFIHHFGKTESPLNIVLKVANHQAVVSGVRHHLGLGIIVTHVVWNEISKGDIVVIKKEDKQAVNRISVVQLQEKIPSVIEKNFLSHALQMVHKNDSFKQIFRYF